MRDESHNAWEVSVFGVFLVRIFPQMDWIRVDKEYLSPYSVQMLENKMQKNSEYGNFSRSAIFVLISWMPRNLIREKS